jgi:hypothetical protein
MRLLSRPTFGLGMGRCICLGPFASGRSAGVSLACLFGPKRTAAVGLGRAARDAFTEHIQIVHFYCPSDLYLHIPELVYYVYKYMHIHGIIKVKPNLLVPMFCFKGDQSIHLEETIYKLQ